MEPPHFNKAQNRHEKESEPDEEELDDFSHHGGEKPSQRDVDGNGPCRDPDGQIHVPADEKMKGQGHEIQIDPGHEHGHDGERESVQEPVFFIEAQFEVAGYGVDPAAVIKGHHVQGQEEHGRYGTDPVEVGNEHPVLYGSAGPSENFQGAEVGRDKGDPSNPGRVAPAGQEEVLLLVTEPLEVKADPQDEGKVQNHNGPVHGSQVDCCHGNSP